MALFQIKTIRIKIMKAIELLKDYKNIDFGCNMEGLHNEIDEAIEELEEIKNRSCSTCKYGRSFHFDKDIECMKLYDATKGLCFEKDFYCKNWEPK